MNWELHLTRWRGVHSVATTLGIIQCRKVNEVRRDTHGPAAGELGRVSTKGTSHYRPGPATAATEEHVAAIGKEKHM